MLNHRIKICEPIIIGNKKLPHYFPNRVLKNQLIYYIQIDSKITLA
ncbi:hypothetical protein PROVRETT_06108 [Providencia rettgeri DSM 1131]|nr:hypothetical protein PROVRETT_06108 [Providencia rettgeri DSM 1131]